MSSNLSSVQRLQQQLQQPITTTITNSSSASTVNSQARARQYTHLQAQLAQLNAHLADMENLLHMTAVQAEYIKSLGGWWGGAFMAASKILGEDSARVVGGGWDSTDTPTHTTTASVGVNANAVAEPEPETERGGG